MPEEIMMIERRSPPLSGQRFIQSCTERYGLVNAPPAPSGRRNALRCERVIVGEVLHDSRGAVAAVRDRDVRRLRLRHEERLQIVEIAGDARIERVVDQHGDEQSVAAPPVCDLHLFLARIQLHVVFLDFRRRAFLADRSHRCRD